MKMKTILELENFVRQLRSRMKYGELSRAPLELLKSEVRGEQAECDCLARRPDVWDSSLPSNRGSQLLFDSLPDVHEAQSRAFRQSAREPPDLIITGKLRREAPSVLRVPSLEMRAKLHDGVLSPWGKNERQSLRLLSNG